jgi:hypothetical protein
MRGITFFLLLVSFSFLHSQPVTLRDTTNQYDYIIITVPEFVNACEPFRQHKEIVRDFRTLIVDTTQIYAEFDSSAAPQDNIRDFISYAGTFWKEPRPKFFLIVGTVSDVPNFLIPDNGPPPITYFNSDYYYSQNIYENDPYTTDFYIGRIPCKEEIEIYNYFSKVIDYESNNTILPWMNNNLFVCDDDTSIVGFLKIALSISENSLPDFMRSYFISEDSNSVYYGDKDSIYKAINERGTSVIWFEGFNGDTFAIRPDYFNLSDLAGLENAEMPFLTIFIFRQSSIIDTNTNITRELLVMNNAGSIGGIVYVGIVFFGVNIQFQYRWAQSFFNPEIQSIGEAFILDAFPPGGSYSYMKKITNIWADPSLKLKYDTTVDVEKIENEIPQSFMLYQNYPNPFNPTTTIKFALPVSSKVKISVYNSLGELVETLVDKEMESGYHAVNFDASRLASGVYLYQLQSQDFVSVKKMLLIK